MKILDKIGTIILADSLIKNSIWLIIASFVSAFLGVIFWILASRYYDPREIGIISAIFSAISLIASISTIGLPTALVYYLPRDSKNSSKIINSCLITSISVSIIFALIFLLGLKIWSPQLTMLANLKFGIIFIILTTVITMSGLMGGAFIAGRRSSYSMLKDNLYHIIKMFSLALFAGLGIIGVFISLSIGMIFALIVGFILLYKTWRYIPTLKFDPIIKTMTRYSLENYIAGILHNLPKLILPIMIVNIISAESTGYFYIAMTAAGLLYGISLSISSSLLAESSNKEKFENNINKAIMFNMLLLIPGILFFIIFGKIILNIFNPIYAQNATETLIILSVASIPLSLINIFNGVRNSQNRVKSTIKMKLIVAILTIILTVPLMKTNGIEGVATAFLIANTIGAIIVIHRIKNPVEFTIKIIKRCRYVLPA